MGGEKMAKSVGNITSLADALAEHGRDAVIMFFVSGHYRQPIQFDDTTMAQAAANVRRVREAARRLVPGPSPRRPGAAQGALLRRPGRRLQHADGAGRGLRVDPRGQPPRARHRRRRPARDAADPRARQPARRRRGADGEPDAAALRAARAAARPPAPRATSPRPIGCATSWPRRAGRCATPPTGRSSCASIRERRDRPLRAQPDPRGAAGRPAPGAPRVGHPRGGRRAVAARRRRARGARARTSPRARGARRTRACAPRSAPTPTSTRPSCSSAPTRSSSCSTSSRTPRTSGRSAARPSAWAPTAW